MNAKHLLLVGCLTLGGIAPVAAQDATSVNVLLNKTVVEVSGNPAADSEGPEKLIDGNYNTKYCIIQSNPYVVIDAQSYFLFDSFKFYDCKTNENEENASAYKIELSMDGKTWTVAAQAQDVADVDLKEITLETPTKARYVKFSPTYNSCARMWELEGFGVDANTLAAKLLTESIEFGINDSTSIQVSYSIAGDKASDFAISALCAKSNVEVGTPVDADGVITVPVKGVSKGRVNVEITITNAGEVVSFTVPVKINSDVPVSDADAIEVSNWSEDFIAESLDDSSFTEGIGAGWYGSYVFYSAAVQEEGALCDLDGFIDVPTSGNVYKVPVAANNALKIKRNADPVELTFVDAIPTETVNFLVFADSEDGISLSAIVKYDDLSESDPFTFAISHWEYETLDGNEAISGLGVVSSDYYDPIHVLDSKNFRVYELSLPADQYKNAKGIELSATGGSWGDAVYVIGVNAHNINGNIVKHLNASLAQDNIKVKQGSTAQLVVNYSLTDIDGLTDTLSYSATALKEAISIGKIVHDEAAHTLTIPVTGVTPAIADVEVKLTFGLQTIKLNAQVSVKSTVVADTKNCLEVSNWLYDVIAENTPADDFSTQKIDDSGWVFFTDEIHPEGAIAGDERLVVTESGNVYSLAPYDQPNAVVLVGIGYGYDVSSDIQLATPIYTEAVNVLLTSSNGEAEIEVTINYEDGTSEEVKTYSISDWYATQADGTEAVYGLGRINRSNSDIASERNYRLFEISVPAQRNSKVKSLNINNASYGTYCTVFALNAQSMVPATVSAIEAGDKTIVEVFNLQGQKVDSPRNGLFIVRYADGSSDKLYIK